MRNRRRLLLLLPSLWVVGLLALPAVLWLSGERQPLLESRAKEEFPPLNRHTFADPAAIRRFDTALLDRFPGRGRALDLHARIAIDLFKDSPNPDVAIGRNGFLYYVPELGPCRPGTQPTSDPADAVDVLARTLVAAGLRTTVALAPSKLFVHDADAPSIDGGQERCAEALERRVDRRLEAAPGGLAIGALLRALEASDGATYLRTDTHWNWRGRELFVRRVLERLRPGLARQSSLRAGAEWDRPTDLKSLIGRPGTERDRVVTTARTPRRPFPAGSVVLLGDSQLELALIAQPRPGLPSIRDVALPGAVYCDWSSFSGGACNDAIASARAIVIEKVARDVSTVTSLCWLPISLVGERLRGSTAGWERVDGGSAPATGSLVLPASGSVTVRAVLGSDRSRQPRLLKIPLEQVPGDANGAPVPVQATQMPQAGPAAPCATPAQAVAGSSLFLPVPAGRRASDLVLQLSGAPGTQIGRPQEVVLDGRVRHAMGPR